MKEGCVLDVANVTMMIVRNNIVVRWDGGCMCGSVCLISMLVVVLLGVQHRRRGGPL